MSRLRIITLGVFWLLPSMAGAHSVLGDAEGFSPWQVDPFTLALLGWMAWSYWRGMRRQTRRPQADPRALSRRRWYFWSGWLVLLIALGSPLDPWGEELFSAHMVQHELMMLVAAPLLVLSRPSAALLRGNPRPIGRTFGRVASAGGMRQGWSFLASPLAAWTIHAVVLWTWHLPVLFEASLASTPVHILQHFSFLLVALLFWWSVLRSGQAGSGTAVLYLFTTALHAGGLGALLTFSPHVWYTPYLATAPEWGLSALEDQQLGGLIMWMPSGLVYVFAGLAAVTRLLADSDVRVHRHEMTRDKVYRREMALSERPEKHVDLPDNTPD